MAQSDLVALIRDGIPLPEPKDDTPRQGWLARILGRAAPAKPDPADELRKALITAAEASGLDSRTVCRILRGVAGLFEMECRAGLTSDQRFE
jgi:hypothetical protein